MFGLFGGNRNPAFTPGIMPDEKAQKPDYGSARPNRSFKDKTFILGGMLQDLDWTTAGGKGQAAMNYVDGQLDQRYQDEERQRRVQAAIELAGGDPKLAAAARVSPDLVTQRYVDNNMLNPLAVNADKRAERGLDLREQGQAFNQGMATKQFDYRQGRDATMDERYMDERNYGRDQDQKMWDYRGQRDARQDYVQDRNYNAMTQSGPSAPKLYDLYDEQSGQPYKAMYNPQTGGFDRVGGVKAGSDTKFSDGQRKAAGFGHRALKANQDILAYQEQGFDPLKGQGIGLRLGLNPDARKQYNAMKREFINAVLRKESGASISNDEYANAERMYFPHPTDNEQTMAQKAAARERAIQTTIAEAGGAYSSMFGDAPQQYGENTDWSRYQPLPGMGFEDLPEGYLKWIATQ